MAGISFKPNKAYPSIPTITGDLDSHTHALNAIAESVDIHERRTNNYLDSFVRVQELVDLGLIELNGDVFESLPDASNTFEALNDTLVDGVAGDDMLYYSAGKWIDTAGELTWDGTTLELATNRQMRFAADGLLLWKDGDAIDRQVLTLEGGSVSTDADWDDVEFMSHFDGADAATTADDESDNNHTITFNADAELDTAQKKWGTASLLLDGSVDSVEVANHAGLQAAAQDFTIEAWVRYNGDPGTSPRTVAAKWDTTGGKQEWILQTQDDTVQFWISTTGGDATNYGGGAFNPAASTWYHIAACRHGNLLRTFVDGTQVASVTFTGTIHSDTAPFTVGQSKGSFPNYHNGWIDDVRYTVGVARYTGNFSVPTAPFPDGGGTDTIILGTTAIDLDIKGLTINLLADTDVAGALTATTYGGIVEANLVDKTANENIAGQWTFDAVVTVGSSAFIALPSAGRITGDDVVFDLSGTARTVRLIDSGNTTEFMMGTSADPDARLGIIGGVAGFTYEGVQVWHANNDGSGSGLDADSVDNIPGTNLMTFTGAQRPVLNDLDEMNVGAASIGHVMYWDGAEWDVAFTTDLAATLISQAEAEAGTATTIRWFSALRTKQAIAANHSKNFIDMPASSFGSVAVSGVAGLSGFEGYQINGRAAFMWNTTAERGGIFDDINGHWVLQWNVADAATDEQLSLYAGDTVQAITQMYNNAGVTAGLQIRAHNNELRDAGFNELDLFNLDTSDTLEANHSGCINLKTTSTARTLTLAASGDVDFPVEHTTHIGNAHATNNYTITEGSGTTLYYLEPGVGLTDTAGGCTIGPGGFATIWRLSTTVYYIWGSEITP